MTNWTTAEIADQSGKTFIVTGANSGLGEVTARTLAAKGAHVILACRNLAKGEAAAAGMSGSTEVRHLDLSDLSSVAEFAAGVEQADVLVNNAGLMAVPEGRTADGFEMQFGTNHLGHFALAGRLLPKLRDRVVVLSSSAHNFGKIALDDLNWESRSYKRWAAYGQSKLADLMFAYELQRRLVSTGSSLRAVAAHPGYASTELQGKTESFQDQLMSFSNRLIAQPAEMGALPSLYAATEPSVPGGAFIGPDGWGQLRGYPKQVGSSKASHDEAVARQLWQRSEELTGVSFP
ncbi:NAD(P)-dependent dehydrogenase (short-subunit alcohol dehydrogenase family) [Psychromicrobium silvestre]|uniref:NAD(P)-dependent dehydrogenase (Short-subunit alcohol dehydrogenase family) n=1 Tax=Psychromicrobium silvestre TaxID=1645614 RepID=A0A7Y9LV62_9MICC|nr:oxidoreductase [Psychromicrobium silvestre]NYE96203.1 NAD(P)-dependent dehydrogenase (short-subunit alcohol dehydrogenase family) [Psychromicrobium silvestre]